MSEIKGYPITDIELTLLGVKNIFLDLLVFSFGIGIPCFLNSSYLYNAMLDSLSVNIVVLLLNFIIGILGIIIGIIFSILAIKNHFSNKKQINTIKNRKPQVFRL